MIHHELGETEELIEILINSRLRDKTPYRPSRVNQPVVLKLRQSAPHRSAGCSEPPDKLRLRWQARVRSQPPFLNVIPNGFSDIEIDRLILLHEKPRDRISVIRKRPAECCSRVFIITCGIASKASRAGYAKPSLIQSTPVEDTNK